MRMWTRRVAVMGLAAGLWAGTGCQKSSQGDGTDAASQLLAIPAADRKVYESKQEKKAWRNPYLVIRANGVGLVDEPNNLIHLLKADDIPQALANLPRSAWPDGRVVAIEEQGKDAPEAVRAQLRKNRAILLGELETMHVAVSWMPPV